MKILLYGSVNLNLIDGSSIWLASLAEMLSLNSEYEIYILSRTAIKRRIITDHLKHKKNIKVLDIWNTKWLQPYLEDVNVNCQDLKLNSALTFEIIKKIVTRINIDLFIVRDHGISTFMADNKELKIRVWVYICNPSNYEKDTELQLKKLAIKIEYFLCQTTAVKEDILKKIPYLDASKFIILPPMIPEVGITQQRQVNFNLPKLGYSGKFSPHYYILETISAFKKIQVRLPKAQFYIVGDKFHNYPKIKEFENRTKKQLQTTLGLKWYGGVSRQEGLRIMSEVDVATSWRHPSFNNNPEISTKILEYASLGLPVIMNRNNIQMELFGSDYLGFVETEEEFVEKFIAIVNENNIYQELSQFSISIAKRFTFESILQDLKLHLEKISDNQLSEHVTITSKKTKRILISGHKLNFIQPLITYFSNQSNYEILIDQWDGHTQHDILLSEHLLSWADIILCEWCLGNAVWYSKNKHKQQKLFVRLHHQEMNLPYKKNIDWKNVDGLIAICHHHYQSLVKEFPEHKEKIKLIYNLFDTKLFANEKLHGAVFNLGFIGMVPKRKSPHIAVETLYNLKKRDKRYTLFMLGKFPKEYSWLMRRKEEMNYYKEFFSSVDTNQYRNSVVFDPYTEDVPCWMQKIGFLLSTSEAEGSHQAIAEGMAAGSIPIIKNWQGANQLYPSCFIFSEIDEAVNLILEFSNPEKYIEMSNFSSKFARNNFDVSVVAPIIEDLF